MGDEEYRMMEEKWVEALQENTKLKTEIERLKAELEQLNEYNSKLCIELTITMDKLCLAEKEIDRLKGEVNE